MIGYWPKPGPPAIADLASYLTFTGWHVNNWMWLWGLIGELYVATREVSHANRHLTVTYMYKAGGGGGERVACSYNIGRYPGAQYWPIAEILQKLAMRRHHWAICVYLLACGLNAMRFASDVKQPRDGRWEVAQVLAGNSIWVNIRSL